MTAAQQRMGKADDGQLGGTPDDAAALADAVAALQHLDASALQRRWRTLVGGAPPKGLGRPLTLRMLAYKLQAERLGDLDKGSRRQLKTVLGSIDRRTPDLQSAAGTASFAMVPVAAYIGRAQCPARVVRPGTMLVREHGGTLHRVAVLDGGFRWNGRTYDSLSQVAFAITGTRWNGPRFFGLRDKAAKHASAGQGQVSSAGKQRTGSEGRSRSTEEIGS